MELGYLLMRYGLIRLEVSFVVSPGFLCLLVCSFFSILGNLLRGFCLHVATNFFLHPLL